MVGKMGPSVDVVKVSIVDTIYSAKNRIIDNNQRIQKSLQIRDMRTVSLLRQENERVKLDILKRYGVFIDY